MWDWANCDPLELPNLEGKVWIKPTYRGKRVQGVRAVVVPPPIPIHKMGVVMARAMTQEATDLLHAYEEAGWKHRWSSKNHLVVYSPDGKVTHGIPPSIYGKTARQRMRALEKWKEEHPVEPQESDAGQTLPAVQPLDSPTSVVKVEPQPSAKDGVLRVVQEYLANGESRYVCAECQWIGQSHRSVTQHYGFQHAPRGVALKPPASWNDEHALLQQVRSLLGVVPEAEVAQLRAENAALRSELDAMRAEREALKDLLS